MLTPLRRHCPGSAAHRRQRHRRRQVHRRERSDAVAPHRQTTRRRASAPTRRQRPGLDAGSMSVFGPDPEQRRAAVSTEPVLRIAKVVPLQMVLPVHDQILGGGTARCNMATRDSPAVLAVTMEDVAQRPVNVVADPAAEAAPGGTNRCVAHQRISKPRSARKERMWGRRSPSTRRAISSLQLLSLVPPERDA